MALNYDSQIELLFPPALFEDAICAPILQRVGIPLDASGNKVLLFTDPLTVAALNAADDSVKGVLRRSRVGLVLHGWRQQEIATFLIDQIHGFADRHASNYEALRLDVFKLHSYVFDGMLGKLDPNPFSAPLPAPASSEKFNIDEALQAMLTPEQIDKPKAPHHMRAARTFGRRTPS